MGLFHRDAACGSLSIAAEQGWALPGERIAGVVVLHLDRALEDTELEIALVGHERLRAVYVHESDRTPFTATHGLVDTTMLLHQGPLGAGDRVVPFSIPVAPGLPPSKDVEYTTELDDEKSQLRVQVFYSLTCTLTVRDKKVKSLTEETRYKIAAWPSVVPIGEPREAAASRAFHYAFLTQKGACAMRVSVPTNVVHVGARVSAHVWLALTPSERLQHVRLSLRRRMVPHITKLNCHAHLGADVCATRFTRARLGDATEFVLHLTIDDASAPLVNGKKQLVPFLPTETFRDFSVAYEVVVACAVRSCKTVEVCIPVTFVAPDPAAAIA